MKLLIAEDEKDLNDIIAKKLRPRISPWSAFITGRMPIII